MVADLLNVVRGPSQVAPRKLPPALRAVGDKEGIERKKRKTMMLTLFDSQHLRRGLADGDQYFDANYTISPAQQLHYYLYGLERYQSFKELAAGRAEAEPKWYNEGCEKLIATQYPGGNWPESGDTSLIASTFAILFLSRSSHKAIAKINPNLGDGVLLGGMGLPPNVADIAERDGKVVETPLAGSIDELLALIEKPNAELDQLIDPRQPLTLDGDVTKRAGQVARLRALVSAGNFEARLVAVRTLGRSRDLDNVPMLVYALTDPDIRVVREADRGLRFYSRKFGGVGLPENAQPKSPEVLAAVKSWKDWYKSVRPDSEFLD
jgi:hypothetical protein